MKENQTDLAIPRPILEKKRPGIISKLFTSGTGLSGAIILTIVITSAIFAPFIAPHDPIDQDITNRLAPPFWSGGSTIYPLGTDGVGRDILSRILYGTRLSILIGVSTVVIAGSLGVVLGLTAGFYGQWVDTVIMRLADIQLSLPFMVLAIAMVAIFGPGITKMILILVITSWVTYGRLVRGIVLGLKEQAFIDAARALGASNLSIIFRHILPNASNSIAVIASLEVGRMILAEAGLSFLGLGVTPPLPAWGSMVADGRQYIAVAWWVSTFPGLALVLTLLGINLLGDWLRDTLDPSL